MEYRVKWEIDIEAPSPKEAAEKAYAIQRDEDSIATVFSVEPAIPERPLWTYTVDVARRFGMERKRNEV